MTVLKSLLLVLAITRFGVNGRLSQNDAVSSVNDQGITLSSPAASTEGSMVTTGVSSITTEQIKAQKRDSTPNGDSGQGTRECGNAETGNHISAADESNKNSARDTKDPAYAALSIGLASHAVLLSMLFSSGFGHKLSYVDCRSGVKPAPRFLAIQDLVLLLYPCTWHYSELTTSFFTFISVLAVPLFYNIYLTSSPPKRILVENAIQKCLQLTGVEAILRFTVTLVFLLDSNAPDNWEYDQISNNRSSDLEMDV